MTLHVNLQARQLCIGDSLNQLQIEPEAFL